MTIIYSAQTTILSVKRYGMRAATNYSARLLEENIKDFYVKKIALFLAAGLMPLAFLSVAHADAALAAAKGCTACHQVDKKILGPAYNAVAACYGSTDAAKLAANKASLVKHVKEGGAGVWGPIPMPAHPAVANEDISKIVDWVLAQKDGTCPKEFKPKA